jgi:uncharacterized protein (TIGR02145 family)
MRLRTWLVQGRAVLLASVLAVVVACCFGCGGNNGGGNADYVTLGGKKWMKKNLNVETADSWCYNNSPDSCAKYGRLYTWEAAKTACPLAGSGWRLPDTSDWNRLVEAVGGYSIAGSKLKSKSGWNNNGNGTDDYGLSALPGGFRSTGGDFYSAGYDGNWWTATAGGSGSAYYRNVGYGNDLLNEGDNDVGLGLSVRCVGD